MNILILNWRDPQHPLSGGAEIFLLEHAKFWQKKGATVTWFGSSFQNAKEKEIIDGITYIRKGTHYTVHFWVFLFFLQKRLGNFDIVIDCFHFIPFFSVMYMRKPKIVALIHEVAKEVWFKNMPWVLAKIGYHIEPYFIRAYKNYPFITVSNSTKKDLEDVGISSRNISVIHNGMYDNKIKKYTREKLPTLLFLGRISHDKGINDALDAYELLYNNDPRTQLWIVGKEEKKGLLAQLLEKRKGNIRYFGFVSEVEKYSIFQKAWILIHPSTREGWGLSVIEANSVGTPVVGYNVPGLRDSIVHNKTGVLVQPHAKSLYKGVRELLANKKKYSLLSQNARVHAKNFTWDESTKKSWSMLQSL